MLCALGWVEAYTNSMVVKGSARWTVKVLGANISQLIVSINIHRCGLFMNIGFMRVVDVGCDMPDLGIRVGGLDDSACWSTILIDWDRANYG